MNRLSVLFGAREMLAPHVSDCFLPEVAAILGPTDVDGALGMAASGVAGKVDRIAT